MKTCLFFALLCGSCFGQPAMPNIVLPPSGTTTLYCNVTGANGNGTSAPSSSFSFTWPTNGDDFQIQLAWSGSGASRYQLHWSTGGATNVVDVGTNQSMPFPYVMSQRAVSVSCNGTGKVDYLAPDKRVWLTLSTNAHGVIYSATNAPDRIWRGPGIVITKAEYY